MSDFFFQIVLFLAGLVVGIMVPLLPKNHQKRLAGVLAVLLVVTSLIWTGYELGRRDALASPVAGSSGTVPTIAAQPTEMPSASPSRIPVPTALLSTNIPSPTETSSPTTPPTATAEPPTPTPDNTPPGTILDVGQTWKQDGAEFTLLDTLDYETAAVVTDWRFTNNTAHDLLVYYGNESFSAKDNLGNKLKIIGFIDAYGGCPWLGSGNNTKGMILKSGEGVQNTGCIKSIRLHIQVDLANKQIKEIIVTASDISRIKQAQWRIPITLH